MACGRIRAHMRDLAPSPLLNRTLRKKLTQRLDANQYDLSTPKGSQRQKRIAFVVDIGTCRKMRTFCELIASMARYICLTWWHLHFKDTAQSDLKLLHASSCYVVLAATTRQCEAVWGVFFSKIVPAPSPPLLAYQAWPELHSKLCAQHAQVL